ncbi:MAG: class I SAM-dependent methyltransferase [Rhodopseudomonas palustris]|nr:class I SAM-dependent methyltransferase [Rhodopseudomonas palustris]
MLKQWQKAVQLVAPSTLDCIWPRHFADCAQLRRIRLPDCPPRRGSDLGSGAGFPGLVIATLAR